MSWKSQKQQSMVLSSIEAEYIATSSIANESTWLHQLLEDIGYSQLFLVTISCDNQSCITLSKGPKFHDHSKHIEIHYHYLCEQVEVKLLFLIYIPTKSMFANILTKVLFKLKHNYYPHMLELTTLSIERGKYKSHSFFSISIFIKGEY